MEQETNIGTSNTSKRKLLNNLADLSSFIGLILIIFSRFAEGYEHLFTFTGVVLWIIFFVFRLMLWKYNSRRRNICLLVYMVVFFGFLLTYLMVMQDSPFK